MIERPQFWRLARLTVDRDNYLHVLQSDRVDIVPEIRIVVDSCPANMTLLIMNSLFTNLVLGEIEVKRLEVVVGVGGDESELVDLPSLDPVLVSQTLSGPRQTGGVQLQTVRSLQTNVYSPACLCLYGDRSNEQLEIENFEPSEQRLFSSPSRGSSRSSCQTRRK